MKKIFILFFATFLVLTAFTTSDRRKVPSVDVKKPDGTVVNSGTFTNNGKPMIISLWATWCVPCKKELEAISLKYADFNKETGIKLITVSIDDARSAARAINEIKNKAWPFENYLDESKNFMKAMKVENVPYTALIDGNGNIVWEHNEYKEGDEVTLLDNARKLANGEALSH